ncbi:MAG: NAD kinase [Nakamurella sp.]
MTRRVLLVAHTGREDITQLCRQIAEPLARAGMELVALPGENDQLGLPCVDPRPDNSIEMVLSLGGDGTLLRAADKARPINAPVLGINLGRVGFLAEADPEQMDGVIQAVIDRNYTVRERMTVDVLVERDGVEITRNWALNEVSVEKATRERILDVVVEVDGQGISAFGCDGVLIATPTGSTAYAFSAGGPIIWPQVEALLVVPSNAHALFSRPLVVAPGVEVTVHIDPSGHEAAMACDGRRITELPAGSRIRVRRGVQPVKMVRLGELTFSTRLVRKFALPVQGWREQRH